MSENPVDPPVMDEKTQPINLADYEDVSGESMAEPLSRTQSISSQVPETTQAPLLETESESEDEGVQKADDDADNADEDYGAIGLASILVAGGMVVAGLAMFLTQPVVMEHPWSRRDYF